MKYLFLLAFTLFSMSFSIAQTMNKEVIDAKGKTKLLGPINKKGLTSSSYKAWFNKNYDAYLVNDKIIKEIKDSLSDYKIKVFLGTWCGDSKRQVPRFYSVLEAAKFNMTHLEVIGLDKTKEAYKQGPNSEEKGHNIHRVPAFILYKNGEEVNRIVESPKETLERDIYKIIMGKPYTPNYRAAHYIQKLLTEKTIDSLQLEEKTLVSTLAEITKGSRELNTVGYVYLRAKDFEKALYIFDLNTKIFPYKHNVYSSLAEAYFETKNYTEAEKNYYKVLSLNPKNEKALAMIEKLKTLN